MKSLVCFRFDFFIFTCVELLMFEPVWIKVYLLSILYKLSLFKLCSYAQTEFPSSDTVVKW